MGLFGGRKNAPPPKQKPQTKKLPKGGSKKGTKGGRSDLPNRRRGVRSRLGRRSR